MKKLLTILLFVAIAFTASCQNQDIHGNKTFTGNIAVTGTFTPSDSIQLDTVAHMLVDTLHFVFGKGGTVSVGDVMGVFEVEQDSVIFDRIAAECEGASADITLQVQYGASWTDAGTGIHTALNVTTAGGEATTSTFTTAKLAPGSDIWCEPTVVTTSPTLVILKLFYHESRAY